MGPLSSYCPVSRLPSPGAVEHPGREDHRHARRSAHRGQEPRVPGGDDPRRGAPPRRRPATRSLVQAGAGAGSLITDDGLSRRRRRRSSATPPTVWGDADLVVKVKEPIASRVRLPARRPRAVHLPAPGGRPPADRRAAGVRAPRRSPTRPSSCPTGRCRCSHR